MALIASRNESTWGQSFMGKIPYSNPNLNPNPTNPNSKPKSNNNKKHLQSLVNGQSTVSNPAVVTQAASDDAYSFNQGTIETNGRTKNGLNQGGYVNYSVGTYSRIELDELRKKLETELEQIRKLNDRILSGQINPRSSSHGKFKKLSGNKRPLPFGSSNKDPKKLHPDPRMENGIVSQNESLMKMCKQLLSKLMKNKLSRIFNKPVDAAALGLYDYHHIVKQPMDLGTVKSNLSKNLYTSPLDFAADVRLTFNNAMLYNPKTDQVHGMADRLLGQFEVMFRPIQEKIGSQLNNDQQHGFVGGTDELQGSSWNDIRTPERPPKMVKSSPARPISSKQNHSSASNPLKPSSPSPNPPSVQSPVPTPSPVRAQPVKPSVVKPAIGKLPKPRAKDPNKRDMSLEEKQKLGLGLQSLPQEKMPQLVQIIRKRNDHLAQEGDEIELDIEALDTETLWELDRFVTNWKKLVSKTKRQALMINTSSAPTSNIDNIDNLDMDEVQESERAEGPKKSKREEEDVDIGEEMPESSFPPVEIEKDDGQQIQSIPQANGNASSSSSSSGSSSDSSSSSDSDSGSSSGSDSDADEAQS